jgi:hypothetical protein
MLSTVICVHGLRYLLLTVGTISVSVNACVMKWKYAKVIGDLPIPKYSLFLSKCHSSALFPEKKIRFLCLLLRETAESYRTQNFFEPKNNFKKLFLHIECAMEGEKERSIVTTPSMDYPPPCQLEVCPTSGQYWFRESHPLWSMYRLGFIVQKGFMSAASLAWENTA